jgi:uncharacterized protein YcnI
MKKIMSIGLLSVFALVFVSRASAHVTVQPKEAVAGYTVSSIRVPNEKDVATIQVRVLVPDGVVVHGIMPVSGWTHTEKRKGVESTVMTEDGHADASEGPISEIVWSGGRIGAGEFMEFPLSVQYKADTDTVTWKAYQTYADGQVVPWDGSDEKHPAPVISVLKEAKVDMLVKSVSGAPTTSTQSSWMSVAALLLSVAAFGLSLKKK